MLEARTSAEAALYVNLRGYALIAQDGGTFRGQRASDGSVQEFLFTFEPPPRERSVERMYGGPAPSKIIARQEWLAVATRVERSVPLDPVGLITDVMREFMGDLGRSAAALHEVAKFGEDMGERIDALGARVNRYGRALSSGLATRDAKLLPLPAHRFTADEATRTRVNGAQLPMSVDDLFGGKLGSWRICAEIRGQDPPMAMFLSDGGALLQATVEGGQIRALKLLEGRAGLKAWILAGFGLGPAEVGIVDTAIRAGESLKTRVERLKDGGHTAAPIVTVYGAGEAVAFFELAIQGPQLIRGALLLVTVDPAGIIRGHRVLSGLIGYNQLSVLQQAQGLLPGSFDEADAETVARIAHLSEHIFAKIAESAYPILATFIGAPNPDELSAALRPTHADYDAVFAPEMVEEARKRYAEVWSRNPKISVPRESENVLIVACTAGGLRFPNAHSRHFHPKMAALSKSLDPRRTWLTFKYLKPGEEGGLLFDGLVWIDDHWSWFPSPWSVLD